MRVIESAECLEELARTVAKSDWVALDTEADSLHAYPEKLCLLQVSVPEGDHLIDPLALADLAPLLEGLKRHEVILHGADYDLRMLFRSYAFVPERIFDTMLAARLLGYTELGLNNLVLRHLGIELEKGPQTMNWARRPLTPRMEIYACNDTHYLHPLASLLREQLVVKGRLAWQEQLCQRLVEECSQPRVFDPDGVWRVRGCDVLSDRGLAVLRELWRWRETEAVGANKPPYFILSHELMVELAARTASGQEWQGLVPRHFNSRRRDRLAEALETGAKVPPADFPSRRRSDGRRLTRQEQNRFEDLKRRRDEKAKDLAIDPSLIASKSTLVQLALDWERNSLELMSWQRELMT